jgi:hypothetical protein
MTFNHEAIYKAYPQVVTIDDGTGAFDIDGNLVELDQSKIDAAAIITNQEKQKYIAEIKRVSAYKEEADPLFFKYQAGEATKEEWISKRNEIRARYPYPNE